MLAIRLLTGVCLGIPVATAVADGPATQPVPATTHPTPRAKLPARCSIDGFVDVADGRGVQAMVFILDGETGIPYSNVTDHPMTDSAGGGGTHVLSGKDGRFSIPGVFPGPYRFVAQSWDGEATLQKLDDIKGDTTTLRGVVDNINVNENQKPPYVKFEPVGNATVHVTFKREGTFVFVSTKPMNGDAILGFGACLGDFLRNLVGANRLRHKAITMHGLPAGTLYFYAWVDGDSGPQEFGSTSVVAKAGETVEAPIPLMSPWNGEIKLPDRLSKLQAIRNQDTRGYFAAIQAMVPKEPTNEDAKTDFAKAVQNLRMDQEVTLPGGQKATWREIMTLSEYENFNYEAREANKQRQAATLPTR